MPPEHTPPNFQQEVEEKEKMMLKSRKEKKHSIWQGFSVFGLIGWSVAIPTVLAALLGWWLDSWLEGTRSYTLMLLAAGIALGILNAGFWVDKKMREMQDEPISEPENQQNHDSSSN